MRKLYIVRLALQKFVSLQLHKYGNYSSNLGRDSLLISRKAKAPRFIAFMEYIFYFCCNASPIITYLLVHDNILLRPITAAQVAAFPFPCAKWKINSVCEFFPLYLHITYFMLCAFQCNFLLVVCNDDKLNLSSLTPHRIENWGQRERMSTGEY